MKKILCLFIAFTLALFCFAGCTKPNDQPPAEEHTCNNKCEYCGKCTDVNCEDEICSDKCTAIHTVAQFKCVYNLYGDTYYELLQCLYSDNTTTIYQVRDGADSNFKSEYYGTWSKSGSAYTINISKRLPEGKTNKADVVDCSLTATTESGLGSDAVYYMYITLYGLTRQVLLCKTQNVAVDNIDSWLAERYKNSKPSDTALVSDGNNEKYNLENVQPLNDSVLNGKRICYLGSSVTYGSASEGVTFVEYIDKRNGSVSEKYAVSGTTLSSAKPNSYVERLQQIDTQKSFDIFVCQLSTNDASGDVQLGTPGNSGTPDSATVCGAIEYIIAYVRETWNCPVVFYTNSYYEDAKYGQMVELLKQIASSCNIGIIDLYSDNDFNSLSVEERFLYMNDKIHPHKAGYLEWWTPKFEEYLYSVIK